MLFRSQPLLTPWLTRAQGGLTLDPEEGELDAGFCSLGGSRLQTFCVELTSHSPSRHCFYHLPLMSEGEQGQAGGELLMSVLRSTPASARRINRSQLLRVGRTSVAIRRFVYHSWYEPAGERARWAGTNWKGSAGQGPAIRTRQALDRKGFAYVYKYQLVTQVE